MYYLAIQNTYTHIQMGIFSLEGCVASTSIDKMVASKQCTLALEDLLTQANLTLADITFVGVNQGPGPFTTLRVVISTINGISFATRKPIIGINAILALLDEYKSHPASARVVLLNAFGNDLYYGIQTRTDTFWGCAAKDTALSDIAQKISSGTILFLGNAVEPLQSSLATTFGDRALFVHPTPLNVSLDHLALMALQEWQKGTPALFEIQPIYGKQSWVS